MELNDINVLPPPPTPLPSHPTCAKQPAGAHFSSPIQKWATFKLSASIQCPVEESQHSSLLAKLNALRAPIEPMSVAPEPDIPMLHVDEDVSTIISDPIEDPSANAHSPDP